MNNLPICPNCQVIWSQEEVDWGCGCCGYPDVNPDFMTDEEDDYRGQKYTVTEIDGALIFKPR